MFDGEMSRPAAQQLRESIVALALNVFQAQHLAVYSYYKDIIRDTPVAELDAERSEEHTSELQSLRHLVCRLLLEKKKKIGIAQTVKTIYNNRKSRMKISKTP